PDVVVPQHPRLFLGEDDDPTRAVRKALEHLVASCTFRAGLASRWSLAAGPPWRYWFTRPIRRSNRRQKRNERPGQDHLPRRCPKCAATLRSDERSRGPRASREPVGRRRWSRPLPPMGWAGGRPRLRV